MKENREKLISSLDYSNIQIYEMTDMFCENMAFKAMKYGINSIVVGSSSLPTIYKVLDDEKVKVGVTIGYPSGAYLLEAQCKEMEYLFEMGYRVDELYVVPAISRYLSGYIDETELELKTIVEKAEGSPVKIMIEAGAMSKEQKKEYCNLAYEAGVAAIVSATGFGQYYDVPYPTDADIEELITAVDNRMDVIVYNPKMTVKKAEKWLEMGVVRIMVTDPDPYIYGQT